MIDNEKFIYIEDCKNDIIRLIKELNLKSDNLDDIYKEYLKEAVKREDYLMSLDVLFFQIELTKKDILNYTNLFESFISKMYGQYYKLHCKIYSFVKNESEIMDFLNNLNLEHDFIPFNDLDEKKYSFEQIQTVHNVITSIINTMQQYISRQKYTVEDDEIRTKKGININHLVFEKTHDIEIYSQRCKLYSKILKNYYDYQTKFMKRMMLKLKLLFFQLDSDIQFETVTHSRGRSSVTHKIDNTLQINKNSNNLEQVLLSELDISHSPIKNTEVSKNIFQSIYDIFFKRILWFICIKN